MNRTHIMLAYLLAVMTAYHPCIAEDAPLDQETRNKLKAAISASKWSDAIPLLKESIRKRPYDGKLRFMLGEAYRQTGDNLSAHIQFRTYLSVEPFAEDRGGVAETLRFLQEKLLLEAKSLVEGAKYARAQTIYAELERQNPDSAKLHFLQGVCFEKSGANLEAYARLLLSLYLNPKTEDKQNILKSQEALYTRLAEKGYSAEALMKYLEGRRALLDNDSKTACKEFLGAIDLMPDDADFRYYESLAQAGAGNGLLAIIWLNSCLPLADAERRAEATHALLPKLWEIVDGQVSELENRAQSLLQDLDEPGLTEALWQLLEVAAKSGSKPAMASIWEKASSQTDPDPYRDLAFRALVVFRASERNFGAADKFISMMSDETLADEARADLISGMTSLKNTATSHEGPFGTMHPLNETDVSFGVAGKVDEILVNVGDPVYENDVLARLDDGEPTAVFKKARSEHDQSVSDLGRVLKLQQAGAATADDVEAAQVKEQELADALLIASGDVSYSSVPWPVDSIVAGMTIKVGEVVEPETSVMRLVAANWLDAAPSTVPPQVSQRRDGNWNAEPDDLLNRAAEITASRPKCRAYLTIAEYFLLGQKKAKAADALKKAAETAADIDWSDKCPLERNRTYAVLTRLEGLSGCSADEILKSAGVISDIGLREKVLTDVCEALSVEGRLQDVRRLAAEIRDGQACKVGAITSPVLSAAKDPVKALAARNDMKAAAKALETVTEPAEKCSALLYMAQAQNASGRTEDAVQALQQVEQLLASIANPFDRAVLLGRAARQYNEAKDRQRSERSLARAEAEIWHGLADGSLWNGQAWGKLKVVRELNASIQEVNEEDHCEAVHQFSRIAMQLRDASRTVRRIQKQISGTRKSMALTDYFGETTGPR